MRLIEMIRLLAPHIPRDGTRLHADVLAGLSGLTVAQVYYCCAQIRDRWPQIPLLSSIREGYGFDGDPGAVSDHIQRRTSENLTRLQRDITNISVWLDTSGMTPHEVAVVRLAFQTAQAAVGLVQMRTGGNGTP